MVCKSCVIVFFVYKSPNLTIRGLSNYYYDLLSPKQAPCIKKFPRLKQTCHYAFMSSQVQNKLPLCALRACVNSQDQNRVPSCICEFTTPKQAKLQIYEFLKSKQTPSCICELRRPKQTLIIHL